MGPMGQINILVYLEYSSSWQLINRLIAMLCQSLKLGHPIYLEKKTAGSVVGSTLENPSVIFFYQMVGRALVFQL